MASHANGGFTVALHLREDVSLTSADHGAVLLDERAGRYWQLNSCGALVLGVLLDNGDLERAVAELRLRYNVSAERACMDVAAFLEEMRDKGLVVEQ
ncbi:lasso peptide biosynthesis PqqD family chaperone [Thermoactinospora rubra]|uniref:lasso peptide biosynthesis PqqD family chaperone n=1 Tax=Thermoactinospora rubra TaxID=1088767 RepID=UPI000A1050BA|nr:lasso peptide biosynthesis PqqD family chaperone [Thermoactinospora rubra]